MEDREIVAEFLIESAEHLARLQQEIVEFEQRPGDPALLAIILRKIHAIKGTCELLAFSNLDSVMYFAEGSLAQLCDGQRSLPPELIALILDTMDVIKRSLPKPKPRPRSVKYAGKLDYSGGNKVDQNISDWGLGLNDLAKLLEHGPSTRLEGRV